MIVFFINGIAAFLGLASTNDDSVVASPFIKLEDLHSKTLEEKKAIVDQWLLTHDINDPIHIDEDGQESRFIDLAIRECGTDGLDFIDYLIKEKKTSCDSQTQHRLQHFITPAMSLIINNAKSADKARVLTSRSWVDTGNSTSRVVSNTTFASTGSGGFAIKETAQIIPCLQIGKYTPADLFLIRVADGDVSACAKGIHRLATWIAGQVDEHPISSNLRERLTILSELEERRKIFFDVMYENSNISIDFWYEGLKNAFEKEYFLKGRGLVEKKNVALSYCTIVDKIKLSLTLKQRHVLLEAIDRVTHYSVSSNGFFRKKQDSDYQLLYGSDTQFASRIVKMKVSLQGWEPPEAYIDPFPPPPPPPTSSTGSSDH